MSATKHNTEKEVENYYQIAYKVADDERENVLIVWVPGSGMEYHPKLTYIVPFSIADQWEKDTGELIQWRHQ